MNTQSILTSVKKVLGITEDYKYFDDDIIMHINTVFSVLTQAGIGSSDGFSIKDDTSVWEDFLADDNRLNAVKSFVYLRVRLLFDPPQSSVVLETMKQQAEELLWRMNVTAESVKM